MPTCENEAGHSDYQPGGHGHHHHHHDHDHSHDVEPALKDSLYSKINTEQVRGFNEHEDGAAKTVFKPWDQRNTLEPYVESDGDEQLLVQVPFVGMVKLKSIWLGGGPGAQSPAKLKVFINRDDLDFSNVDDCPCTQEWALVGDANRGEPVEYHTRIAKFNNVRSLTLYFPDNFGDDVTRLHYIGFTGEWTELHDAPLVTVYELQPNLSDHKVRGASDGASHGIF
ncbi:hypothetical protein IWQ62_006597 [Dispira parvispora]|uniref:PITH domain-containing protein n=1 Tax=Dispira parvispora TaxID=1520584 RepID=A0A9W8AHQ4_9FUNG|nr:hypothetical protein IWQ62_006597 [Dispira parvispora]